mmetsp:Transcript_101389/g.295388  ORF Transcript_101389/g.295388 Transcript_101389/m.295388 type:complete len:286 (-) Transcript_101389:120-977(-)
MNDYSKWDKLQDSDEEQEPKPSPELEDEAERCRVEQELVERWLRKEVVQLNKAQEPQRPPELKELAPYRKITKEELKVLAMLLVLSHFDEGKTNLDRHPQMLELARHHRWLEEDPGTLELLCRVHSQSMRKGSGGGSSGTGGPHGGATLQDTPEDQRMRQICFSGINTLAAPRKAKCAGGLLELVTMICTPASEHARELRKQWQKKEFAKDAIFASLFPDLQKYSEESQSDSGMKEVWVVLAVLLLIAIVIMLAFLGPSVPFYTRTPAPSPPAPQPFSGHAPTEL